jgi:hypothetical protein
MTRQHLIGELSVRLEQLQRVAQCPADRDIAYLRQQVETRPVTALAAEIIRAVDLADRLCWESLSRGDTILFARQAEISADLRLFAVCALLLDDQ